MFFILDPLFKKTETYYYLLLLFLKIAISKNYILTINKIFLDNKLFQKTRKINLKTELKFSLNDICNYLIIYFIKLNYKKYYKKFFNKNELEKLTTINDT